MEKMDMIQDQVITKLVLESLLTNGKVTIEEAQFFSKVSEKILEEAFVPVAKEFATELTESVIAVEEEQVEDGIEGIEETRGIQEEITESEVIASKLLKL